MLPFFVYGTLRRGERNCGLMEGHVVAVQDGVVAGLELWDLGAYPMAVEGIGRVVGELVTVEPTRYAELLARLDALEAVSPAAPTAPGGLYWRARRTVLLPGCGGPSPEAWIYLGDPAHARQGRRIPSGDWLRRER